MIKIILAAIIIFGVIGIVSAARPVEYSDNTPVVVGKVIKKNMVKSNMFAVLACYSSTNELSYRRKSIKVITDDELNKIELETNKEVPTSRSCTVINIIR